jgi:hypothetical protein
VVSSRNAPPAACSCASDSRASHPRIDPQHRLPGPHRLFALLQRVFVKHRDPLRDRLALGGIGRDLEVFLQHIDQLDRARRARQQPLQRQERVAIVRARRQRRPPRLDRVRGAAQRILEQPRGHRPQLGMQVRVAGLDGPLLQRGDQLAVQAPARPSASTSAVSPEPTPVSQPGRGSRTSVPGGRGAMNLRHSRGCDRDLIVDCLQLGAQRAYSLLGGPTAGRPARE